MVTEGQQSFPELRNKFPMFSEATLQRDIKLLKETGLIVDRKIDESRIVNGIDIRKVFIFFKDDKDIVGNTKKAMEILKHEYTQITLDQIASYAGLPPGMILNAAYALAPKLGLLIGSEAKEVPPSPIVV